MTNLASNNNSNNYDGNQNHKELQYCAPERGDDFSALEQHIEDLTQEKFSLQRGLEASRVLGESLAAENASLTEAYNQQGAVINQLKSEMDNLQEEIKTQLAELETVKKEYTSAHLECCAADERAKLLASEVIQLDEKVLRLRSSKLKLVQQLEHALSQSSSYKKKISRLERERQELQENIAALKEDKKLLQSKIHKSSASANHIDGSKSTCVKKDSSTSTEDMDGASESSNIDVEFAGSLLCDGASSYMQLHKDVEPSLEITSICIPADHMGTIDNINALISELAIEKEELTKSLIAASCESSRLKEWNNELCRRLEIQTQRLELLTAQSMANVNNPVRNLSSISAQNTITLYADEGDEVVERVLGWIMKLFPGGPSLTSSKRRTSKFI